MQGTSQQELPERSTAPTSPHSQTSGAPRSPSVSGSTRDVADREGQGRARGNTGAFQAPRLGGDLSPRSNFADVFLNINQARGLARGWTRGCAGQVQQET